MFASQYIVKVYFDNAEPELKCEKAIRVVNLRLPVNIQGATLDKEEISFIDNTIA